MDYPLGLFICFCDFFSNNFVSFGLYVDCYKDGKKEKSFLIRHVRASFEKPKRVFISTQRKKIVYNQSEKMFELGEEK